MYSVTTFLEFLETWKCRNSAKVKEKSGKRHKVREKSGNLSSQGYLIVTPWLRTSYNLPVLYSYYNLVCISDVGHFELTLVSC